MATDNHRVYRPGGGAGVDIPAAPPFDERQASAAMALDQWPSRRYGGHCPPARMAMALGALPIARLCSSLPGRAAGLWF